MVSMVEVLDRIGIYLKTTSGAKIGRALGKNKNPSQHVRNWRERGTIPWEELFLFSQEHDDISMDWLLTGKNEENDCRVKCDKKLRGLCKKVKEVVESKTHWGKSLEANIESFKIGLDGDEKHERDIQELRQQIKNLEETNSKGQDAGTTAEPVSSTGRKRKAGSSM
jgi:hypothetical protein